MIFFGFIAVCGSFYLQRLALDATAWIGGFAVGSLAVVILAINNLRDIDNDRASNKRTLAARFGTTFARTEIVVLRDRAVSLRRGDRVSPPFAELLIPMLALIPAHRAAPSRRPQPRRGVESLPRARRRAGVDFRNPLRRRSRTWLTTGATN